MPIKLDEQEKYSKFIVEIADELDSLAISQNQILWHYTNGPALVSILESGKLYSTQVSCLNDSRELSYASDLIRDAYIALPTVVEDLSEQEQGLLREVIKYYSDPEIAATVKNSSRWFVSCFSERKDDLSQWRAYGSGENGYAIAFAAGGLWSPVRTMVRINYDFALHQKLAAKIAKTSLQFYREGELARSETVKSESDKPWSEEFFQEWDYALSYVSPFVKHHAFAGEKEYRLLHQLREEDFSELKIQQKNNLLARHLPIACSVDGSTTSQLPIREIMVGPSRHKEISAVTVRSLLKKCGYDSVNVSLSEVPFQSP